jgi:hypothetical protein
MAREDEIKKLINTHYRRLRILEEQKALYGSSDVPPKILIDIEDTKAEIRELQAELEDLKVPEEPSPSSFVPTVPHPPPGLRIEKMN